MSERIRIKAAVMESLSSRRGIFEILRLAIAAGAKPTNPDGTITSNLVQLFETVNAKAA